MGVCVTCGEVSTRLEGQADNKFLYLWLLGNISILTKSL